MLKKILTISMLISIGVIQVYPKSSSCPKNESIKAVKSGFPAVKKLLKKVSINCVTPEGDSLLHYAVRFNKRKLVEYLVEHKIDISAKGGIFYGTALEDAIYYGYLGMASYLIDKGTNLNITNIDGDTALHIAARNGYLDIVEELVSSGASKNIVNKLGHLPYDEIPELSWDSHKKLESLLFVKNNISKNSKYSHGSGVELLQNMLIRKRKNTDITIIDKKTQINNTDVGINVEI
ncbi:MAG: ankyrin repeat domain-containing protein, partial [Sulfurovaceae bacterium]|nr:ankyrin repeat domain-containing protein [Sulfurovaceae bacterium]